MRSLFHSFTSPLLLFRRHVLVSASHLLPSLGVHAIEAAKILSDGLLLIGRQASVFIIALSYLIFSLIGKLLPVRKACLGVLALIFSHAGPVLGPPGKALPALGWQAIPVVLELGQDRLL